jgi:hypothetical protein
MREEQIFVTAFVRSTWCSWHKTYSFHWQSLVPCEWAYQRLTQWVLEQYYSETDFVVPLHDQKIGVLRGIAALHVSGVGLCLWTVATNRPIFPPPDDIQVWKATTERHLEVKTQKTWRKTCPTVTSSTKNPTWPDLGINLDLHGERLLIVCHYFYMNSTTHIFFRITVV